MTTYSYYDLSYMRRKAHFYVHKSEEYRKEVIAITAALVAKLTSEHPDWSAKRAHRMVIASKDQERLGAIDDQQLAERFANMWTGLLTAELLYHEFGVRRGMVPK